MRILPINRSFVRRTCKPVKDMTYCVLCSQAKDRLVVWLDTRLFDVADLTDYERQSFCLDTLHERYKTRPLRPLDSGKKTSWGVGA